ncbi:MAG: hypothetical protein AAF639_37150 [Chloroflexota bacterium]
MMIISNSSPLIALGRINRLDIFQSLFDTVYIPTSVYDETTNVTEDIRDQRDAILAAVDAKIIHVVEPSIDYTFRRKLDAGEKGALNLALEHDDSQLIMDDRRARNEAKELRLTIIYTTDVLKGAERRQLISSYDEVMEQLHAIGIYLPE